MSRGRQSRKIQAREHESLRKKIVLLFGESDNDRRAIKELAEGLRPELRGHVEPRPRLVLVKGVTPEELGKRKTDLSKQVAVDRVKLDVRGVLIHEDCDAVEPAQEDVAKRYADTFRNAGYRVHPVLPAWELEAWWLLWPRALGAYRESWREPTEYRGKHVGRLRDAKQCLEKAVQPKNLKAAERKRFRGYQESDSPGIAKLVCERGWLTKPEGRSDSYAYFRREIDAIDF
jgi:hypothetical protein